MPQRLQLFFNAELKRKKKITVMFFLSFTKEEESPRNQVLREQLGRHGHTAAEPDNVKIQLSFAFLRLLSHTHLLLTGQRTSPCRTGDNNHLLVIMTLNAVLKAVISRTSLNSNRRITHAARVNCPLHKTMKMFIALKILLMQTKINLKYREN